MGQYKDEESGLYYNRFRYYNCEIGAYISQDPIGLKGNNPNLYAYTHDSNSFVDIFGLGPHGLATEVIRNGQTISSNTYTSGGGIGGGRLNQQEALLTHTERKFLDDIEGSVQQGDHLKMTGQLNPCKPGCQPAIRDFVLEKNVTAEYFATDTNMHYSWEKTASNRVIQTESLNGKVVAKYEYNMDTRKRTKITCS